MLARIIESDFPVLKVAEGTKLNITCTVYGLPTPTVHWYKESKRLSEENTVLSYLPNNTIMNTLMIFPLTRKDSGSYMCVIEQAVSATEWIHQNSTNTEVIVTS